MIIVYNKLLNELRTTNLRLDDTPFEVFVGARLFVLSFLYYEKRKADFLSIKES